MTTTFPAWAHGLQLELEPPKAPWPVWPDAEWVDAIMGSKLGAPDNLRLNYDRDDGLCFIFNYRTHGFDVVFSCQPKRRRGILIAERCAPCCWSPGEARTLLDAVAVGEGWISLDATLESLVAPENRGKEPAPSVKAAMAVAPAALANAIDEASTS